MLPATRRERSSTLMPSRGQLTSGRKGSIRAPGLRDQQQASRKPSVIKSLSVMTARHIGHPRPNACPYMPPSLGSVAVQPEASLGSLAHGHHLPEEERAMRPALTASVLVGLWSGLSGWGTPRMPTRCQARWVVVA